MLHVEDVGVFPVRRQRTCLGRPGLEAHLPTPIDHRLPVGRPEIAPRGQLTPDDVVVGGTDEQHAIGEPRHALDGRAQIGAGEGRLSPIRTEAEAEGDQLGTVLGRLLRPGVVDRLEQGAPGLLGVALVDERMQPFPPYRIDASTTIVDMMPTGYTGFIGRYQDPSNFYLFMVDGLARYQIQLWHNGVLTTLQPWSANPLLNPAGYENVIGLEDNGTELHFWANGSPLAILSQPALPAGEVGLLGGAGERSMAEIHVDWLRVYDLLP